MTLRVFQPLCLALLASAFACGYVASAATNNFALFWPRTGVAVDAEKQFSSIFRPILQDLCRSVRASLPADFGVRFEEFYLPSRPSYSLLDAYGTRLSGTSFLLGGTTSASELTRRLIRSVAPRADWQLHYVDPPPLRVLVPSLLKLIRTLRQNDSNAQAVAFVVGPPYQMAEVQSLLRAFEYGVMCYTMNATNPDPILDDIWGSDATTIVVVASRNATASFISDGLDGSLWSPDYRWILFDSALIYSVKDNLMPTNSRNITSVEFGPYSYEVSDHLLTTDQVMLHDLLSIWTAYLANLTCGFNLDGVTVNGLTGLFNLSSNGSVARHDWRMAIYRDLLTDAKMVGSLSTLGYFNMSVSGPRSIAPEDILSEYRKLKLIVSVIPGSPYSRFKTGMENRTDIPLRYRLEGLSFDLCMEVLANLGLTNLSVEIQKDLAYGSLVGGQWNGVVETLIEGVTQIACVDLTPTTDRKEVIDFSESYLVTNMSVLYKSQSKDAAKELFQFVFPFHSLTWLYLCVAMVAVAIVLALLHRISPNDRPYDLRYSIFFSFASLFQGITGSPPDRPSGRMVVTVYWLFVIALLVAYVGNYAAMRTLARLEVDITTVQSLLDQTTYTFGTLANSSLSSVFRDSTFMEMRQLYQRMRRSKNGLFTNQDLALTSVMAGKFALIYDTPTNEYMQQLICDSVVTGYFENTETAFGLPKKSDLKPLINVELRKLIQKGRVMELYDKYFIIPDEASPSCTSDPLTGIIPFEPQSLQPRSGALTLHNTLGLLTINVIGCCLTLFVACMERGYVAYRKRRLKRQSQDAFRPRRRSTIANILWESHV